MTHAGDAAGESASYHAPLQAKIQIQGSNMASL